MRKQGKKKVSYRRKKRTRKVISGKSTTKKGIGEKIESYRPRGKGDGRRFQTPGLPARQQKTKLLEPPSLH